MTNNFQSMLNSFASADMKELVKVAHTALPHFLPQCKAADPQYKGMLMLTKLVLSAIGADRTLSAKEREMLRKSLELTDGEISDYIGMFHPSMMEEADRFADSLAPDTKAHLSVFLCALIACDAELEPRETAFIKKILE